MEGHSESHTSSAPEKKVERSSKLRRARKGRNKILNKIVTKANGIFGSFNRNDIPTNSTPGPPRVRGGVRLRGCLTDDEHRQVTKEIVERLRPLRSEEGLRVAGFEFRSVPLQTDADDHENDGSSASSIRLFHIESDTMITLENRKDFIADGDMYEAIARVCQQYAQEIMIKEGNLEWTTITEQGNNPEPIRAIVSTSLGKDETCLDTTPTLLIATGKGKVRAGIFSRQHLICSGMECSTAVPIVKEAIKRKMNIIMIDPNVHGDRLGMKTFEASLSKLFRRWEEDHSVDQPPLGNRDLYVLSHSQSGAQLASYLLDKSKHYVPHIRAVAFTDSTHNIQWSRQDEDLHQLLQSDKCVYFKVSRENSNERSLAPLESVGRQIETDNVWRARFGEIVTRCAGTTEHSLTNWFALRHIWDHFDHHLKESSANGNM